jgi:hypothetical protein
MPELRSPVGLIGIQPGKVGTIRLKAEGRRQHSTQPEPSEPLESGASGPKIIVSPRVKKNNESHVLLADL